MSDFKVKMHQFRFPLGLRRRPRLGSLDLQRSPSAVLWGPSSKGREGREGKEMEKGMGRGGKEGREGECICRTNVKLLPTRLLCRTVLSKTMHALMLWKTSII